MERFLYRWLPLLFGCHCRPDRSFHFRGKQFPICARCTGLGLGFLAAAVSLWFFRPPFFATLLLMAPMIIDGICQQKTAYESKNPLRLITGILFTYGLIAFIVLCDIRAYHLGETAKQLLK